MNQSPDNIVIISSSTRDDRQSHKVAKALRRNVEKRNRSVHLVDLLDYPLVPYIRAYHPDKTNQPGLEQLAEILDNATGLIFVSPEYNGSYTGALKNTLDHFPKTNYRKKAIGVVSVSSGGLGGMRAALQMQQLVLALFAIPSPTMLLTPNVEHLFDDEGHLIDSAFEKKINLFFDDYFWLHDRLVAD